MKDLRIVFMGTPQFAVSILEGLLTAQYNVVGVITAPDRPAGRGQKLRLSAVKEAALAHDLPLLQPTNLKDPAFINDLKDLRANLQIIVAFRMLPEVVWAMPAYGTFNLHASLLPQYRGAAPINWALINGEKETGVTTFFIDEKIDTGAILFQEKLMIGPDENAGSLHDRLMYAGVDLVLKTVQAIANDTVYPRVQQHQGRLKTAYKLHSENTRIDWEAPRQVIHNHIRGLSPYPSAWTEMDADNQQSRVKIYATRLPDNMPFANALKPGDLKVAEKRLFVGTGTDPIEILQIQLAGKRKMDVQDLLNGYNFDENIKMR
ncbi:MAG: methionyl-tRNA formyltransferase [Dokdonia sp.]|jgi:methionyl-tRNA formyltransferase